MAKDTPTTTPPVAPDNATPPATPPAADAAPELFNEAAAVKEFAALMDTYGEHEFRVELYDDDADSKRGGRKIRTPVREPIGTVAQLVKYAHDEIQRAEKLMNDETAALVVAGKDGDEANVQPGPRLRAARFLATLSRVNIVSKDKPQADEAPPALF